MQEKRYDRTINFNGNSYRIILAYLNGLTGVIARSVNGELIYSFARGNIRVTNSEGKREGSIFLTDIDPEVVGALEKLVGARV